MDKHQTTEQARAFEIAHNKIALLEERTRYETLCSIIRARLLVKTNPLK